MKKLIALLLVLMLLLTGCGGAPEEESAAVGEYVEGESQTQVEGDLPEKVEGFGTGTTQTPDTPTEETPSDDTPSKETPDTPTEETPSEQETPKEEKPTEEPVEDPEVKYDAANKLKIISYNIRYTDDPGGNSIDERAPRLKAVIDKYDPDLVGFQEATPRWITHIYNDYGDEYEIRYKYRSTSNSESTPLMWRKDKFELEDEGYFWLSETPEEESKGWGASLWRICYWVKLKIKATGKTVLFFNTHFDGPKEHHIGASELIIQRAKKLGGFTKYAVFLTGDFNMTPWSPGYGAMVSGGEFSDVNEDLNQDKSTTTDGYNETDGTSGHIIDFTFYSPAQATPLVYKVLNEQVNGGYVSDHRGLYTEVAVL
ncbi:MAG: endonuclease/exonuclease/phosphatase family protein [Clostridia bacterium]|nr:endonuclease/exonuclease/phosphatase family protein [Clostridia bacterium]